MSPQVESFTLLAVVAVFFLSTGTSPAMSEGECNFNVGTDVLDLVHNDPFSLKPRDHLWVRDGDKYPGLLCQIRGRGGLSDPLFYKNGALLEARSRINGSTLTFPTFTAEDQGQYECGCSSTVLKSNDIILYGENAG